MVAGTGKDKASEEIVHAIEAATTAVKAEHLCRDLGPVSQLT